MNEYLLAFLVGISVFIFSALAQFFGTLIKNKWNSPKLKLRTDDFYPYETSMIKTSEKYITKGYFSYYATERITDEKPVPCFYYHLILDNNGRSMAKNVIVKIVVYDEDGNELDKISQIALEYRGFVSANIAAHSHDVFDLCYIDRSDEKKLFFSSIVGSTSRKRQVSNPLGLGTYIVKIHIFADNFKQKAPYRFKITRTEGYSKKNVQIKFDKNSKNNNSN